MIKVLIVDDQALIREGLTMMMSLYEDIKIVGEAENGVKAAEFIKSNDVDVILMDIRMPEMDGVEATKIIKEICPQVKILILTTFKEDEYVFEGLKNGADGYMLKDVKSDEIVKGIKTVYKGEALLHPQIATKVVKAFSNMYNKENNKAVLNNENKVKKNKCERIKGKYEALTVRETEIAYLVAEGLSNKEIAEKLYISEGTVKNHISKIFSKLEVRDRMQLSIYIKKSKIYD